MTASVPKSSPGSLLSDREREYLWAEIGGQRPSRHGVHHPRRIRAKVERLPETLERIAEDALLLTRWQMSRFAGSAEDARQAAASHPSGTNDLVRACLFGDPHALRHYFRAAPVVFLLIEVLHRMSLLTGGHERRVLDVLYRGVQEISTGGAESIRQALESAGSVLEAFRQEVWRAPQLGWVRRSPRRAHVLLVLLGQDEGTGVPRDVIAAVAHLGSKATTRCLNPLRQCNLVEEVESPRAQAPGRRRYRLTEEGRRTAFAVFLEASRYPRGDEIVDSFLSPADTQTQGLQVGRG